MNKGVIQLIGNEIRELLVKEFPDSPSLERQCKRASILFAEVCKGLDIPVSIYSGHISKPGDQIERERGHLWNVVRLDNKSYLVDLTLSQFSSYLGIAVADVVILPDSNEKEASMYLSDGLGEYIYRYDDVRYTLMEKTSKIIKRIQSEEPTKKQCRQLLIGRNQG